MIFFEDQIFLFEDRSPCFFRSHEFPEVDLQPRFLSVLLDSFNIFGPDLAFMACQGGHGLVQIFRGISHLGIQNTSESTPARSFCAGSSI